MNLPPYANYPRLISDSITLREVQTSDINDLIEISTYDSIQATTLHQAITMQDKINIDYQEGNSIHWCIVDNLNNKIVGTCGYYRGLDKGVGELGCVLLPQYRGKGFMGAALQLAIDFGLNNMELNRILAFTTIQNHKAIQLLTKLRFIKIADLQDNYIEYEYKP